MLSIILLFTTIYNSSFQNFVAQKILKNLLKKDESKISVKAINFSIFSGLKLKDILIHDSFQDTLLFCHSLNIKFDDLSINNKIVKIRTVEATSLYFKLYYPKNDTLSNLEYFLEYLNKNFQGDDSEWKYKLNNMRVINSKMKFSNFNYPKINNQMDYSHIEVSKINGNFSDFKLLDTGIIFNTKQLSLEEKSGFVIKQFSSPNFLINKNGLKANKLIIITPNTYFKGKVSFMGSHFKNFKEFNDSITITGKIDTGFIDCKDIRFFTYRLEGLDKKVIIKGNVNGKVNHLKMKLSQLDIIKGPKFKGFINIAGIPETDNMTYDINIQHFFLNKNQVQNFPIYPFTKTINIKKINLPKDLSFIKLKGKITGEISKLKIKGNIISDYGIFYINSRLKINRDNDIKFSGIIDNKILNLHHFLKNTLPEKILILKNTNIYFQGKYNHKNNLSFLTDIKIKKSIFDKLIMENLHVNNTYKNKKLSVILQSKNKLLPLTINSNIIFKDSLTSINYNTYFNQIDFSKLFLKEHLKPHFLSFNLSGKTIIKPKELTTKNSIKNLLYQHKKDSTIVSFLNFSMTNLKDNNDSEIEIRSDMIDATLSTTLNFSEIIETFKKEINILSSNKIILEKKGCFSLHANLKKSDLINNLLKDSLKLGNHLEVSINYQNNKFLFNLFGHKIKREQFSIQNFKIDYFSEPKEKTLKFESEKINIIADFFIKNPKINFLKTNRLITNNISWDNNLKEINNKSNINFNIQLKDSINLLTLHPGNFNLGDNYFRISKTNTVQFSNNSYAFDNLVFESKDGRSIIIDGKLNGDKGKINISTSQFNLKTLLKTFTKNDLEIDSKIDINLEVSKNKKKYTLLGNINSDTLNINKLNFINNYLKFNWEEKSKNIILNTNLNNNKIIFKGNYLIDQKKIISILELNGQPITQTERLLSPYIKNVQGSINGKIKIDGQITSPNIFGTLEFNNLYAKINELKTSYSAEKILLNFNKNKAEIKKGIIYDRLQNQANIYGLFNFSNLSNPSGYLRLSSKRLEIINTKQVENNTFGGKIIAKIGAEIEYENHFSNILANIYPLEHSKINILTENENELSEMNYIRFKEKKLNNNSKKNDIKKASNIPFKMEINTELNNKTQLNLKFDKSLNDNSSLRGEGSITVRLNSEDEIKLNGEYKVDEGKFLFTSGNLVNKLFTINKNGKIIFNGPIEKTYLNLTTTHNIKAALSTLIGHIDSSNIYKALTKVKVVMNYTGSIINPRINFSIELPDADESTLSKVNSILNQNTNEINKQVFSLLFLGRFSPPEGITNNNKKNNLLSNALISGQINKIISKLNNNKTFGIQYTPEIDIEQSDIKLNLSTQLFNERLRLYGNVGYNYYQGGNSNLNTSSNNNNRQFIRDLNLEYKISKNGKIRLKAFNRQNQFTFDRENDSYTQGIGFYFKEDFNTFPELFNKIFQSFKKKTNKHDQ